MGYLLRMNFQLFNFTTFKLYCNVQPEQLMNNIINFDRFRQAEVA